MLIEDEDNNEEKRMSLYEYEGGYDDIEFDAKDVPDQWADKLPFGLIEGEVTGAKLRPYKDDAKGKDQMWLDVDVKGKSPKGKAVFGTASFMVGQNGNVNMVGLKVPKATLDLGGKKPKGKMSLAGLAEKLAGCKVWWNITENGLYNEYRALSREEYTQRAAEAKLVEAAPADEVYERDPDLAVQTDDIPF